MSKLNDTDPRPQTQQEVSSKQTDDNGLPQDIPVPLMMKNAGSANN